MADRHRSHHHASRPASTNPSRSSLPAGLVYQPSYADDSYLMATGGRHLVTAPRGYSSSTTSSGQSTTTRTYPVTQDPGSYPRTRDQSHSRRSTIDSTTRPPVIITTMQNDRSHNHPMHSTGLRNGSPVRDDYRHANSQYYAVPASTTHSRSSTRPYQGEDRARRRDRGDSLLSPHDAESYRQPRPSVTYRSNPRHSSASIDYGDDGYRYTNAGELVRYDLDHSRPSRSQRHDSFNQGYYRPKASYAGNPRRSDGLGYGLDRGYGVPHDRSGAHGDTASPTRRFDKMQRDYALGQDRQAPPAAPKPPKPLAHAEAPGNFREAEETRHRRPVSVSQEPSYWENPYHTREDFRDRHGHVRDRSDDDKAAENRRPHSTHFYDDSVPARGFGVRTRPDIVPGGRQDNRRDGHRSREESRRSDYLHSGEKPLSDVRKSTQDHPTSETRHQETDRRETDRGTSYSIFEAAGTGLGISAAAASLVASKRDNEPSAGVDEKTDATHRSAPGKLDRHEALEISGGSAPKDSVEATKGRHSPRTEAIAEDCASFSANGGETLVKSNTPSATDSDDAGRGRAGRTQHLSGSFNPRDTGDLRKIREQLAALKMQDGQEQSGGPSAGESGPPARSPSPSKAAPATLTSVRDDENYAVGFPVEKKHTRVVSPPRDKRDDKPLRGILKQPSASFPEEANPIREGVAPHKEDRKLKEVPPGARWTKINRRVVNPEALTIGQERFEERDDFVIVLRVLSKEEIQAYAAATQVLRERRRNREEQDREQERGHRHDEDSSGHHRRHRHHRRDGRHDDDADGKPRGPDGDFDDDEGAQGGARVEGSDSSVDRRWDSDKDGTRMRRSRRDGRDGDAVGRGRDRAHGDDRGVEAERRERTGKDADNEREPRRNDGDRYHY